MTTPLALAGIKDDLVRFALEKLAEEQDQPPRAIGAFSAYRTAALSLATGAVVTFDTVDFSLAANFDITTNLGRVTPTIPGYYRFSTQLVANAALSAATKFWNARLYKNGALLRIGDTFAGNGTAALPTAGGTWVVQANGTTDYFEIVIVHNEGVATALAVGAATGNYFEGELIGTK